MKRRIGFAVLLLALFGIGILAVRRQATSPREEAAPSTAAAVPGDPAPASFDERWATGWARRSSAAPGQAASGAALAQSGAPRRDGGRPHRNERWAARMQRVSERAREELRISDTGAEKLRALESDLRRFKQQVHEGAADGHFTRREADLLLKRRYQRFQRDVGQVVGPDHVGQYLAIVKDVRRTQRVE